MSVRGIPPDLLVGACVLPTDLGHGDELITGATRAAGAHAA
jgi:hypothetical protein